LGVCPDGFLVDKYYTKVFSSYVDFLMLLPTYFLFHFLDDYRVMHVTREEADEVITQGRK
jgi:hypothetical protein